MRKWLCGYLVMMILCLCASAPAVCEESAPDVPLIVLEESDPLPFEPVLTIYCLNLRGCDGFVILSGGQSILMDSGRQELGQYVYATLRALGVSKLDAIVSTHPHIDHCGGFYTVLKHMPVDVLYHCFREDENEYQVKLLKIARENNVPIQVISDGDTLLLGGALFEFFQYDPKLYTDYTINNHSLITRISVGEAAFLNPADISRALQIPLADDYGDALNAQIFKMPHHGYDTAARVLLEAINPQLCLITSEKINSERSRNQLRRLGIPFFSAGQGPIRMCTDGTSWTVQLIEPLVTAK